MQPYPMTEQGVNPRGSRRWLLLTLAIIILVGAWCALWFYAAGRANTAITGWLAREARAGRIYTCGDQSLGGFPFRIEVRCVRAGAELKSTVPPLLLRLSDILVAAQIYQPTLLISEWNGPLTVSDPGATQPNLVADWTLAQTSVRGTPQAPERISIVFDKPVLDRFDASVKQRVLEGEHAEIHARMASGTLKENPVVDIALRLTQTKAPFLHPLAAQPTDADIDLTLRGLKDLSGKPWPARFREIQASSGRIEIKNARISQAEWLAVGAGALGISPNGRLDGELKITVAGLDKLLSQLGVDELTRPESENRQKLNDAFNALDKIAPGLGNLVREKAAPAVAAGAVSMLGQPAELEGRKAVALPLRFDDGVVFLGPLKIGETAPLF